MAQSNTANSSRPQPAGDRRSSGSRTFFARLLLVLAFPFWFPRLFFWLVVEFVRYHFTDWAPQRDGERNEGVVHPVAGRPSLKLISGGGMGHGPHRIVSHSQPAKLTLIKSDPSRIAS